MNFTELNKDNFLLFAIKHYVNPKSSTQDDFMEDLNRFRYIKRWLRRYHESGSMNSHLLLNHILIVFNCWQEAALPMLFYKLEPKYWGYVKSFLVYLDRIPEYPHTNLHDIESNQDILNELRGL